MALSEAERYAAFHDARVSAAGLQPHSGFAAARRASILRLEHNGERFGDAPSDVYLLTSVLRGAPYVDCRFHGYRLNQRMHAGDLMMQPLQEGCDGHADARATIQIMAFDGSWFRGLMAERSRPFDFESLAVRTWRDPLVSAVMQRMWQAMRTDAAAGQAWLDAAALTIFGSIGLEGSRRVRSTDAPLGPAQMRRVQDFVDAHLGEPIGLAEMAAASGLSVWHFARSFSAARRQTPHRYLMMRRLQRARELLEDGQLSVAAIAYACGFSSQAHFTTRFREATGIAPAAYRRSL